MAGHPPLGPLTCKDLIGLLLDYLEAALTPEHVAAFEAHLAICPPCVAYLNTYRRTRELTRAAEHAEMPEEMKAQLRQLLLRQLSQGGSTPNP